MFHGRAFRGGIWKDDDEKQTAGKDVSSARGDFRVGRAGDAQGTGPEACDQYEHPVPDHGGPGRSGIRVQGGLPQFRAGAGDDSARAECRVQFAPAAGGQSDGESACGAARRAGGVRGDREQAARLSLPQRCLCHRARLRDAVPGAALPVEHCDRNSGTASGWRGNSVDFRESIHRNRAEGQDKSDLDEIRTLVEHVQKNGYLFRREGKERWNITFPVEYNGDFYGVSFYGDRAEERNFDRLLFECSLLASRLHSALVRAS